MRICPSDKEIESTITFTKPEQPTAQVSSANPAKKVVSKQPIEKNIKPFSEAVDRSKSPRVRGPNGGGRVCLCVSTDS